MCLVAIAIEQSPRFSWVIASNRDEFFNRPTAPLAWWSPQPGAPAVLSGRDLLAGGTWLGLSRDGRLALVTNVRGQQPFDANAASRGALVLQWLQGGGDEWLAAVARTPRNGYNLLLAELRSGACRWLSNQPLRQRQPGHAADREADHQAGREPGHELGHEQRLQLGSGMYGLSNAALDTPWPKVTRLKAALAASLAGATDASSADALAAAAYAALADAHPAADDQLPDTGVSLERERALSPAFIRIPGPDAAAGSVYGTRCSTVVIAERVADLQTVHVFERRFGADGEASGETVEQFEIASE